MEHGYQLETDSLGGESVLRRLKGDEVMRPVSASQKVGVTQPRHAPVVVTATDRVSWIFKHSVLRRTLNLPIGINWPRFFLSPIELSQPAQIFPSQIRHSAAHST
jgi:hypothetical protein